MPKPHPVHIGSLIFDPEHGTLRDARGTESILRPQTKNVMQILAAADGALVSKDQLMEAVWPDTHVTDDSLVQCISEIRKALGSKDSRLLRTVPKKGYKLEITPIPPPMYRTRHAAIVIALTAMVGIIAVSWNYLREHPASTETRSLAVLPFANVAAEDTHRYFANGITEDLVVGLSKVSDLRVASIGAASAAAEDLDDPRKIALNLDVKFLVDGSVRRRGENLRMTVALIDGETGGNAWAESYEGSLDDVFAFQDAVLEDLVRVLSVRLSPAERARLGVRGTNNASAYDEYLRGKELQNYLVPTANEDAAAAFGNAILLDPYFAEAHAYLSLVLSNSAEYGWAENAQAAIEQAIQHADRAVELAPDVPFVLLARGRLRSRQFVGDLEGSLDDLRTAIEADPGYDDAYAFMAIVMLFNGQADKALESIETTFDRNPNPPYWYYIPLGISNYHLGKYEAAANAFLTVLEKNPNSPHAMRNLIATYGRLGRLDDAEWYIFEYESLGHTPTISEILAKSGKRHEPYREAFAEGLRLAGVTE